jgi:hypothetical protein
VTNRTGIQAAKVNFSLQRDTVKGREERESAVLREIVTSRQSAKKM